MGLIAFRTEYQISADPDKNRLFYKPYAAMQHATSLPFYLSDWERALAQVRPGFTVLTDLSEYALPNTQLFETFVAAQQLIVGAQVRYVAEVHQPEAATRQVSAEASGRSTMPVRRFADLWAADQFLDEV